MVALLAIGLFLAFVAFAAVNRNQEVRRAVASETADLVIDGFGVRRTLADGREEAVDWTEVTEVEVKRAKRGVHGAAGGVVVLAGDEARGCLVPIDRIGESGLVEHLDRLPGFDMHAFVLAIDAEPPRQTVCWTRQEST